jgi:hypothetical protein
MGNDHVATWAKSKALDGFFEPVDDMDTVAALKSIADWVDANTHYKRPAKSAFLDCADPWLIAAAVASKATIVTYEIRDPDNRSRIKIPDVAHAFNVDCIPPYAMLRVLQCLLQFDHANCN